MAPSLTPALETLSLPIERTPIDRRVLFLCALAIGLGLAAAVLARELTALIGLITNLAFYGRWSTRFVGPAGNHLGAWVIFVPVVGGLVVGLMARYGSDTWNFTAMYCRPQKLNDPHAARAKRLYSW